jgi:uncharacterized protein (TIGR00369 family)
MLEPSKKCFGCAAQNPVGLRLKVERDGDHCVARFVSNEHHQGWEGMLHGGVLAALMDEIMAWALWCQEVPAVTGSLSLRYLQPAPIGEEILVRGWLARRTSRAVETRAEVRSATGALIAEAKALCVMPAPSHKRTAQ